MTEKIIAALRSAWAHVLAWRTWLSTWKWTLKVNGNYVLLAVMIVGVLMVASYWNGKWSARDVRSYAVSFLAPEPKPIPLALPKAPKPTDPDVRLVSANADLEQQVLLLQNENAQLVKEVNVMRAARPVSDDKVDESCKPKVRYVRVREKSFVCDVFGACK